MLLEVVHTKCDWGKSLAQKWPSDLLTFKSPASRSHALHALPHFPSLGLHQIVPILSLKKPSDTSISSQFHCQLPGSRCALPSRETTEYPSTCFHACSCNRHGHSDALVTQSVPCGPESKPLRAIMRPRGSAQSGLGPLLCLLLHPSPPLSVPSHTGLPPTPRTYRGSVVQTAYMLVPLPVTPLFFAITWIHPSDLKAVSLP